MNNTALCTISPERAVVHKPARQALVVVGSSTGGMDVLDMLFSDMNVKNIAVIIVQHIIKNFIHRVAMRKNKPGGLVVSVAQDGEQVMPGHAYFSPDYYHLTLKQNRIFHYDESEPYNRFKPSIDVLMNSIVASADWQIIGIILTGMATDGVKGMVHIKEIGGFTIAQDPKTAAIASMPRNAIATGCIDLIATPQEIREVLLTFDKTGFLPPLGSRIHR